VVACAYSRLRAVKRLVRRGAAIVYHGQYGLTSAIQKLNGHGKITAWLLVGRFTEQRKLEDPNTQDCIEFSSLHPWSGPQQKPMRLTGFRERKLHESLRDYVFRLARIRKYMRGKVLPPHRVDSLTGLTDLVCYEI
jgi:hypothetical protein